MHFTRALRWLGAPDKSHMGYCNQFSGLSYRMGRGFSVIRLVLDPPHPDPNPFCFQADRRWYSLFSNPFGTPLLDGQNQQLRSVATKNLLGACSGICPSPSFSYEPLKSFAAPVKVILLIYISLKLTLKSMMCPNLIRIQFSCSHTGVPLELLCGIAKPNC